MREELRIGNKIQDGNGFIFEVVSIFKDGTIYCDFKENEGDVWEFDKNNPCYGIPLTEDILLKCGFEYCNNGYYKYLIISEYNYLIISRTNTIYIADCPSVNGTNIELHEVESLHQLQNLYFALTNQELNIELWK